MTKKGYFKDARLLEALDYIDTDLIGEVAVKLNFEESAVLTEEPVMTWRTPFKHWKRMLAAVACLLLLSAAIPVLDYAVQQFGTGIWEGNAGAGTEALEVPTVEETQALETESEITEAEVIDFDKALERYADMSADEIYAEVMKGGWIVQNVDTLPKFDAGEDLWQEFLLSVDNKKQTTVLFADFTASHLCVRLSEICYDGETFTITQQRRDHASVLKTEIKEFKYLLSNNRMRCIYYFANHPDAYPINVDSDGVFLSDLEAGFVIIWSD